MSNNQKPAVSWSQLSGFGGVLDNVATPFSDGVGGAYFEAGKHKNVTIEVVEPKISSKGKFMLLLSLKGEGGETIRYNVMLEKGDGKDGFHFTYQKLAAALSATPEIQMRAFGKLFATQPQLLQGLVGLKMDIEIGKGKDGYKVEQNAIGQKVVIDVATGKEYPEFAGRAFADYEEIKAACKEYSIYRMKNEVKNVSKSTDAEVLAANEEALSEVLRSAETPAAGKASTASRAARPARTI